MKTTAAARIWKGVAGVRAAYRRGWSNGYAWGVGTVFALQLLVLIALEAA